MSDSEFVLDIKTTGSTTLDAAASSADTLAARFEAASKASVAASDAVKAGEAIYNRQERAADSAAKALERVGIAAEVQKTKLAAAMAAGDSKGVSDATAKLQSLAAEQTVLSGRADAAAASLTKEAAVLDKLKAAAATAESEEKKLADEMAKLKPPPSLLPPDAEGEGISFEKLERGANKLGGPLGSLIGKVAGLGSGMGKLTKSLGDGAPYAVAAIGITAVVAAVVALTAAVIEGLAKIVEFAIGLADANRTSLLLSQGIARSVAGGAALNDKINALTKTLPLTEEELQGMAQKLASSGLHGAALEAALSKAATTAARLKFGPDFAKEMLSLNEQSKVFHANLAEIFGGLKTDALMEGLQKLIALFDANTTSGKTLKVLFESLFQPLIDWLVKQVPKIERFFIQLETWVLKGMTMIKPYGSTIEKVFIAVAIGIGAIVAIVAIVVVAIVVAVGVIVAVIGGLIMAVMWVKDEFVKVGKAIGDFFKGMDLGTLGKNLIDGLVNGIKNGADAVLNAMKGVVQGAIDGAKKLLGIASPSKVFAEIGMQTGAGMSVGVDKSAAPVKDSLEAMVATPVGVAGKNGQATPAAASGKSGGASLSGVTFNFYGVSGAEDALSQFTATLTRVVEGDTAALGTAVPNA